MSQTGQQPYPYSDVVEERTQTPTKTKAINVQIGPGDPISNIPVVMDFEHHQIHEGETHEVFDEQLSLGTSTVKYAIEVPTGSYPHMVFACDLTGGSAHIRIYEGATFTNGSAKTSYNRNRNSLTAAETVVTAGVTSADGTQIESFLIGASNQVGGSNRTESEILLKTNTTYRVDVEGLDAGVKAIVKFRWYEDLGV